MVERITPAFAIGMLAILTIAVIVLEIQCARLLEDVTDIFGKLKALTDWMETHDRDLDRIERDVADLTIRQLRGTEGRPYDQSRDGGKR